MFKARLHRFVIRHCMGWCLAGVLLAALQPFLFNHFRQDGWEDEPGFRLRGDDACAMFEPDRRVSHDDEFETTLYAPLGARLDRPEAFGDGMGALRARVSLSSPLRVAQGPTSIPQHRAPAAGRVSFPGGAPPPAHPWRRQPPRAAPPSTT